MSDRNFDEFDGIEEEDNPMPDWWLWTFLLSIIFAALYFMHYHIATDESLAKEYAEEKIRIETLMAKNGPKLSDLDAQFAASVGDPSRQETGKAIYTERCAVCHGSRGEGLIGPNLTDRNWIHGNQVSLIAEVIANGVLTKGMPAWGQILSQDELISIVGYVKSLEGKMEAGKAPEGEVFN